MLGPFYTPELGLGIDAATIGTYHPDLQNTADQNSTPTFNSYASSTGALSPSVKNCILFNNDLWRAFVEGSMANIPTHYWGQGFHAGDKDNGKEEYTAQALTLRPTIYRQLIDNAYLDAGWSPAAQNVGETDHDDSLKIENTPQGPPVFSFGANIDINWGGRDFVPNPRRGQYANFRYTHYAPRLGDDTRSSEFQLHYSHCRTLSGRSTLAQEVDGAFTQGDVPWNMMSLLDNDGRVRGYYQGRYRGKNVVSSQPGYRRQFTWWRGIVVWVEAGTMRPSLPLLNNGRWPPTGGVDYRPEFKPRVNIRPDYGIGKDSSGFYFQVGEAF